MPDRWQFLLNRLREQLWVRPLLMCLVSIAAVFLASMADLLPPQYFPEVGSNSIEALLKISSSSMLVIATFAVGSMVSAYAYAGRTATPRSFALVVADDVSQNALSVFVGAFIFSIIALVALTNGYYDKAGRCVLFFLTLLVFAVVILTFVRWVDRIARLGRLETTIRTVENATRDALRQRRRRPALGGIAPVPRDVDALPVFADEIGYVQRIEIEELQRIAERAQARIEVAAPPGSFMRPGRELARVTPDGDFTDGVDLAAIAAAFRIGTERTFDEDPRFGMVVLSEIASRALSPGINDAGTAIQVVGTLVRILATWGEPLAGDECEPPSCDRVEVPELSVSDMFDDSFRAIARDGAGQVEVVIHLLKGLRSLATCARGDMSEIAAAHARNALARAESALEAQGDLVLARELAQFAESG